MLLLLYILLERGDWLIINKRSEIWIDIICLFTMSIIIASDTQYIFYLIVTARYVSLFYLILGCILYFLWIFWVGNKVYKLNSIDFFIFLFILTIPFDLVIDIFHYARITLFLIIIKTSNVVNVQKYENVVILLGFFFPSILSAIVKCEVLGFNPVILTAIGILSIIPISQFYNHIRNRRGQSDNNLQQQKSSNYTDPQVNTSPRVAFPLIEIENTLLFVGFIIVLTLLTNLLYDPFICSLFFYFLEFGMILNIHIIHKYKSNKRIYLLLGVIDVVMSISLSYLLNLISTSILYPMLCIFVLLFSFQSPDINQNYKIKLKK